MNAILNGKQIISKQHHQQRTSKAGNKMVQEYPLPEERLNWLIHVQHVRGEVGACRELIKRVIEGGRGRNEYAFFKQVIREAIVAL